MQIEKAEYIINGFEVTMTRRESKVVIKWDDEGSKQLVTSTDSPDQVWNVADATFWHLYDRKGTHLDVDQIYRAIMAFESEN